MRSSERAGAGGLFYVLLIIAATVALIAGLFMAFLAR